MCLPWLFYFPFVFVYLHGGEKQHFLKGRERRKEHEGSEQSCEEVKSQGTRRVDGKV